MRGVGLGTGGPEVVERAQDVVLVAGREGERQKRWVRDLAGRAPPEETALEQILLAAFSCLRDLRRRPDGPLVLEQPLEHADCGVVRRAHALRRVAVPPAVLELLADEPTCEVLRRTSEVGAERERAAVDARLHLAVEERLRAERLVPPEAGLDARHRGGDARIGGVDAGRTQQLHREEGWQPVGLAVAVPRAIRALAGENLGAEPFARNARTLRGDRRRRGVREIAQRLPANGRVRIEQPIDRVHRRDLIASDFSLDSNEVQRSSTMPMCVRHPEAADGVALEIEFDQHDGFVPNDPAIVTWIDRDDLGRLVLDNAAVRVLDVNLALHQETHVRVHAELGADQRFHVD